MVTYLIVEKNEVALYFEGSFCEEISGANLEMLCKRPGFFTLEYFPNQGLERDLLNAYAQEFLDPAALQQTNSGLLLQTAKAVFRRLQKLPEYSWKTAEINSLTVIVREALQKATSPGQLLLQTLPSLILAKKPETDSFGIAKAVSQCVTELEGTYSRLLEKWTQALGRYILHSESYGLHELRKKIGANYSPILEKKLIHVKQLEALLRRLCDPQPTDQAWLEGIGSLLTQTPCKKWTDESFGVAQLRLHEASKGLIAAKTLFTSLNGRALQDSVLLQWFDPSGQTEELVELSESPELAKTEATLWQDIKHYSKQERLQLIARLLQLSTKDTNTKLTQFSSEAEI